MKIERTRNATRNIIFGSTAKTVQILIPFFMRTAMIHFMGLQYLGLNSLFTSILRVLNLAELGVGNAMVYSMYKPIAEDDVPMVCALMRQYKLYYRCIGIFIAVVGLAVTPLVPNLIKGDVPGNLNIYVLYLLNLLTTALSYWLFAYKNCLLTAHQRTDITSKITLCVNMLQFLIQFMVLVFLKNYYVYLGVALCCQILINILTAVSVSELYPLYKPNAKLDKRTVQDINGRIKDLFIGKLGGVVLNSADTLVISASLGLTVLAVYQNYYFIIASVYGLVEVILTSITAGIGNSFITESKEKNYNDLKKITFLFVWLIGVCTCCFLGLFQPFMKIWVGEELQMNYMVVICFCIYFFMYELIRLLNIFKDANGIWHKDRFRPLVSAIVNLSLNLMTVRFLGIYGIILSTIIALLLVELPWLLHNIFTVLFQHNLLRDYMKSFTKYILVVVLACLLTGILTYNIHMGDWLKLCICAILSVLIPNVIFLIFYRKQKEFTEGLMLLNRMTKGKVKIIKQILHI